MAYNSITYKATGSNYKFRNIYYVSDVATYIKVYKNSSELSSPADFSWLETDWGIELVVVPSEGDLIKIEDIEHDVVDPIDSTSTLEDCIGGIGANSSLIYTNIADIETLETEVNTNIPADIAAVQADADSAQSTANAAAIDASNNAIEISVLESDNSTQQSEIDTNTSDIAALTDQEAAITSIEAEQTVQNEDILANAAAIQTNTDQLSVFNGRLTVVETAQGIHTAIGKGEIVNGQATPINITLFDGEVSGAPLWVDGDSENSAIMELEVYRKTDSETRFVKIAIDLHYVDGTWYQGERSVNVLVGALSGVTLSVANPGDNVGWTQYISDTMAGANYEGFFRWQIVKLRNTL